MLYYIFDYLDKFNFPGAGLFNYISFRAAMALLMAKHTTSTEDP